MPASREARPTICFVDEYCQLYEDLFPEVRSFEAFKLLHLGMVSEIKRKSLPAIAKAVGLNNQQNLHHFLTESPWPVQQLRQKRLELTIKILNGRSLIYSSMKPEIVRRVRVPITSNGNTLATSVKRKMASWLSRLMD